MKTRGIGILVALSLVVVVFWPAAATVLNASRESDAPPPDVSVLIRPTDDSVPRPLVLAATSLELVLLTESIAVPIGVCLGLVLFRTDAWGRRALVWLMAISAFMPMPLHASAWLGAFGNAGRMQAIGGASPILVGLHGAAIVHALAAIPWVMLLAGIGSLGVEREVEESALLDLSAWQVFFRVTLRRSLGGIAAATLAVAVLTAGDMTVTDLLQVRTYAEEAYLQYQLGRGPCAAAAVTLPPLALLGLAIVLGSSSLFGGDSRRFTSVARRARVWNLGGWRIPVGVLASLIIVSLVALPLATLIWRAGRVGGSAALGRLPTWSLDGLTGTLKTALAEVAGLADSQTYLPPDDPASRGFSRWLERGREFMEGPLATSVLWSGVGATFATILGWGLAWNCIHSRAWRILGAIAVALALASPGPVAGMALVLAYRDFPTLYDSQGMIVLAAVLRTFPFAYLVIWPDLRALPQEYLEVAEVDGLRPWGIVRRVALPLTRRSVVASWWVAFVLALGELPATNLITPPGTTPLTVMIWGLLHTGVESHLSGVVIVLLVTMSSASLCAALALSRLSTPES
ncbi:ABC transporter permease [Singulisphaera sp. PoT]|uniref:ABC transporter permease n=1 Tax=Singulisphaera sp. PoT TaxID=3411797 RepID=UPI003BF48FED